jgi:hypothetical protein
MYLGNLFELDMSVDSRFLNLSTYFFTGLRGGCTHTAGPCAHWGVRV